jgi:uncharacterized protein
MAAVEEAKPKPAKPIPVPSPESAPFWKAAREHRLLVPRCNTCGKSWFPPSQLCPHCLSGDTGWIEASGRGHVFSFVVFHRVYHPAFTDEVPYVVAIVELEEGPRMLTNVIGVPMSSESRRLTSAATCRSRWFTTTLPTISLFPSSSR